MKILITDDEPLARQRLERMLSDGQDCQILQAANGVEAVNLCQKNSIDLVFLDIRMPEMDGLEAAWHLSKMDTPPAVVFVTAYDDYALKAFSVNAIDYLLKPVNKQQLAQTIEKAGKLNRAQMAQVLDDVPEQPKRQHISARLRGEVHLIPITQIIFFQADHKYVNVKHLAGEALIEEPLKQLEQELGEKFVRIHRNALINKDFITGLSKDPSGHLTIQLKHCELPLEVSRRHASSVRKLVKSL